MSVESDTAERYRQRAEELRVIASEDREHSNREALNQIANDYERMAQSLLAIERSSATIRKPRDIH